MTGSDVRDVLTRVLLEQAETATVTPSAAAERQFWERRSPRSVRLRRAGLASLAVALVVAVLVGGLLLAGGGSPEPSVPVAPPRTITPTAVSATVADATAHLIGNGAVVGDRMWVVLGDQLLVIDDDGGQVSVVDLPAGTDGESLCCVQDTGPVVVVPTAEGYSLRDEATGREVATAASAAPGPAAVVSDGVWVRTDVDRLALLAPGTGRLSRTVTVDDGVDALAADEQQLYVGSQATSTVVAVDAVSGTVTWSHPLDSPAVAMVSTGRLVFVADARGRLTVLRTATGAVIERWRVPAASTGPRPRVSIARGSVWWSPDAGTVVRLRPSDAGLVRAVAVSLDRLWDNADQQRNGLYVTSAGIWLPTRNDGDDYEFHRLPLAVLEP